MVNEQLWLNIILFAEKLSLHIQLFSTVKCKPKRIVVQSGLKLYDLTVMAAGVQMKEFVIAPFAQR